MDDKIIVFLGRFHPLVVHLPIGILLLAGLMQLISLKSKKYAKSLYPAISFTIFWGGLSSLGAIFIGWLLSLQGGYDSETLFWHKWLGITMTVLSFLAWIIKSNQFNLHDSIFYLVFGLVIVLVGVTGHLGGNLTHGETYLMQYAPNAIKKIAGFELDKNRDLIKEIHPDSIAVFPYFIQPILEKKCTSCHNALKKEGGLLLTNYKEIIKGGDNGSIINTKLPYKSELLNRVSLPKGHKKFMPPRGNVMTFGEIQIFDWWMRNGADSISKFSSDENMNNKLTFTLLRDYDLDYNTRAYYEKVKVDSLSNATILALNKNNFEIDFMGESIHMISVKYKGDSIKMNQIEKLLLAKDQITWLDLSNCNLSDDMMYLLKDLTNLTRLNLNSNPITDLNISSLDNLDHLSSINLYNTEISNTSLEKLVELPSLSKLYIWKTDISPKEIMEISNNYEHIDIVANLN